MADRLKAIDRGDLFVERPGATRLIVGLHGYGGIPAYLRPLIEIAPPEVASACDFYFPRLPHAGFLSRRRSADTIRDVTRKIDAIVNAAGHKYETISLVGHSIGGLMSRGLYCNAWTGFYDDGPIAPPRARDWAERIDRIVLLAGVERGWSADSPMQFGLRVAAPFLEFAGRVLFGGKLTFLEFRRGAPFLTDLRLQFLDLWRRLQSEGLPIPLVTLVLGTDDDLVAPSEHLDATATMMGDRFKLVAVPETDHYKVIAVTHDGRGGARQQRIVARRAEAVRDAIYGPVPPGTASPASRTVELPRLGEDDAARLSASDDRAIKHVVFVVHGIRDKGYWTHWLGTDLKARGGGDVAVETPSYGFFPIVPFLIPGTRRNKVEWLLDKYVDVRCRYPNAKVSFVGHSNGTYLLARGLELTRSTVFERIVFAGSPVRRSFDWSRFAAKPGGQPRVKGVLNFVASGDWVVALFGAGLGPLRYFDLGSAGHRGFSQTGDALEQGVTNVTFAKGSHGAALQYAAWPDIAGFVLSGTQPAAAESGNPYIVKRPSPGVRLLGAIATPTLLLGLALVGGIAGVLLAGILGGLGAEIGPLLENAITEMSASLPWAAGPLSGLWSGLSAVGRFLSPVHELLRTYPHSTGAGLLAYLWLLAFIGRRL